MMFTILSHHQDVDHQPLLTAALFVLASIIYAIKKWLTRTSAVNHQKPRQLPGPRGWPIIGYMPHLTPAKLHTTMGRLVDTYGPLFQLQLGSWNTVFLADYELIKKAFHSADFAYRPRMFLFEFFSKGSHGLLTSNGELWRDQRRFTFRHLMSSNLGAGRSTMETHIQREALDMVDILKKNVGQPLDFNSNLNIAVTNIIWALVAGKRMAHDDPVFINFMKAGRNIVKAGSTIGIIGFMPWLQSLLPPSWIGLDSLENEANAVYSYFEDIIREHRETFDPNDLRDYTDCFIDEQRRQKENNQSTFTDVQLLVTMGDLFVAGGETTATTLRWAFLLLSWYPEVQKRMQDEIFSVVGRERLPTFDDREMMPYTDAVIHEIQRFADIIPLGVFHSSGDENVEFEGFMIPKNSIVTCYIGSCFRDKKYWAKPDEFYPEHFLDEFGKMKQKIEGFIPFSLGKRRCIGENLARMELFYFITYFFQTFSFDLCQNDPKPSLERDPDGGLFCWPQPYKVVLELNSVQ